MVEYQHRKPLSNDGFDPLRNEALIRFAINPPCSMLNDYGITRARVGIRESRCESALNSAECVEHKSKCGRYCGWLVYDVSKLDNADPVLLGNSLENAMQYSA